MTDVVCLRPEKDFRAVGVSPPENLSIAYRDPSDEDVVSLIQSAKAMVLPSAGARLSDELFHEVNNLKLIQFTGAGWDRIAESVLRQIGCFVSNVPGVNAIDVAEYVVVSTGTLLRKLKLADELVREGKYTLARRELAAENVRGFRGVHVGVVGLGHIGFTVAKLFNLLGSKVVYYDPAPRYADEAAALGIQRVSLDELLVESDVVTVHVPLIEQTRALIGASELQRLKPSVIIVQASRGGVIDQEALIDRLVEGAIGGVALDVYTTEPLPMHDGMLNQARLVPDRLLLTPHIAGVTQQAAAGLYSEAWANVERVLLHQEAPLHQVFSLRTI